MAARATMQTQPMGCLPAQAAASEPGRQMCCTAELPACRLLCSCMSAFLSILFAASWLLMLPMAFGQIHLCFPSWTCPAQLRGHVCQSRRFKQWRGCYLQPGHLIRCEFRIYPSWHGPPVVEPLASINSKRTFQLSRSIGRSRAP